MPVGVLLLRRGRDCGLRVGAWRSARRPRSSTRPAPLAPEVGELARALATAAEVGALRPVIGAAARSSTKVGELAPALAPAAEVGELAPEAKHQGRRSPQRSRSSTKSLAPVIAAA